ncbi:hypothetical protein [Haliangium sp.]|uniref:hypothetical protein n=1 Tax=Haliangium sp. TaxID=2663208 RepID=UPI003D0CAEC8
MDVLYYFWPYPDEAGNRAQLSESEAKARGRYNRALGREGHVLQIEAWDAGKLTYVEYPDVAVEGQRQALLQHRGSYPGVPARMVAPAKASTGHMFKLRNFYSPEGELERGEGAYYVSDPDKPYKVVYRHADGSIERVFEYEYDARGLCTMEKEFDGDGKVVEHLEYEYDDNGNEFLRREIFPDGTSFETEAL